MGNIYYDNSENPHFAMAVLGDFTYFDGEPSKEHALFLTAKGEEGLSDFRSLQ